MKAWLLNIVIFLFILLLVAAAFSLGYAVLVHCQVTQRILEAGHL